MSKFLSRQETLNYILRGESISLIYPGEKGIIHISYVFSDIAGDYFIRACEYKHGGINYSTIVYVVKALLDKGFVASTPIRSKVAYPKFIPGESIRDSARKQNAYDTAILKEECGR